MEKSSFISYNLHIKILGKRWANGIVKIGRTNGKKQDDHQSSGNYHYQMAKGSSAAIFSLIHSRTVFVTKY